MTFHVLYNDCHLEADTEREKEGRGERDKKKGWKEGGVGGIRRAGMA